MELYVAYINNLCSLNSVSMFNPPCTVPAISAEAICGGLRETIPKWFSLFPELFTYGCIFAIKQIISHMFKFL